MRGSSQRTFGPVGGPDLAKAPRPRLAGVREKISISSLAPLLQAPPQIARPRVSVPGPTILLGRRAARWAQGSTPASSEDVLLT